MNSVEKLVASLVVLLSILGIAFTLAFLITGGGNDGFARYPVATYLHVLPGLLYLALAPLQFSIRLRKSNPAYHRRAGRVLAVIAIVLGTAALFIGIVIPFSGLPEQVIISIFSTFFVISTVMGVRCARLKRFTEHREWMLRAFAIGLSIVTMRLIFIPILIVIGSPSNDQIVFYSIFSFTISFVFHSVIAELWIRYTKPETLVPGYRSTIAQS